MIKNSHIEYTFKVYSRRWGHYDAYRLKRTDNGWHISHMAINGDSNKRGEPYLYANFNQDYINYPHDLGDYMEHIWERAENGLPPEEVQLLLQDLAFGSLPPNKTRLAVSMKIK